MNNSSLVPRAPLPPTAHEHVAWHEFAGMPAGDDDISFSELFRVLQKRKLIIFGCIALMMGLALAASLYMTPKYEATAEMEINKENSDMLGLDDMTGMMGGGASDSLDYNVTLQTQAEVLQSDTLAFQVVEQLGLEKRKEFTLKPGLTNADEVNAEMKLPLEQAPLRRQLISKVWEKHLKVKTVPGTRMIEVTFLSPDRQVAANVVNTLVSDYMEQYFRTRYSATAQASDWLQKQLDDLKAQVESSQQKLNEYQKKAGILGTDENHNIVTAKLEELNTEMSAAEANRIMKETVWRLTKTGNAELISGIAGTSLMGTAGAATPTSNSLSLIQNLRAQQAGLKGEYAQAAMKFGPAYPKLVQMRSQLKQLDSDIQTEIGKVASRSENDYLAAKNSEDMLRASFDRQKADAEKLQDSAIQYVLKKLKEAGVLAGLRSTNIVVVDPARTAAKPARPSYPMNLGLGFGLGLLG